MRPSIRPATPDDVDAIARVVRDAYSRWTERLGRESSPVGWDYAELIATGERAVWVLETGRGIVGVLVLEETSDSVLVHNVAVMPEAQRTGHGRRLLSFAEAEARRGGHSEVRLVVNALMTENVSLYEHVGFRTVDRFQGDDPDRAYVLMAKTLAERR